MAADTYVIDAYFSFVPGLCSSFHFVDPVRQMSIPRNAIPAWTRAIWLLCSSPLARTLREAKTVGEGLSSCC